MGQFKEFLELLSEAGKEAVEIKWNKKGKNLYGEFLVKDQKFEIEVTLMDNKAADVYQFKFYRDKKTKMHDDFKYNFSVVPTIREALDYSVNLLKPDVLVFASSDESSARKSMYKLEAAKIAKKYHYNDLTRNSDLVEMGYSSDVIFGIYKSDEIITALLNEI